jgi:hypothetical protein
MVIKARHLTYGMGRGGNPLGGIIIHQGIGSLKMMAAPTVTLFCIMLVTCSSQITVLKRLKEFNSNNSFGSGKGHDSMPKSKEDILSHNTRMCRYLLECGNHALQS